MSSASPSTLSTSPSLSTTSLAESVSSIQTAATSCTDSLSSSSRHSLTSGGYSIRPNEHLAILLPRSLWKRDSLSNSCDTFSCPTVFSSFPIYLTTFLFPTFERRHHCRKCGGVFCRKCTSRTTPLLDARDLPFLFPPRNTSIYDFVSEGGFVDSHARVCDDCWDQLHGTPSMPQTPELKLSMPQTLRRSSVISSGDSSLGSTSIMDLPHRATTFAAQAALPKPSETGRSISTSSNADSNTLPLGELSTYPLCRPSLLCKAAGGGRWVPKQVEAKEETRASTLGIGKALWEVEWEREIRKERRRRENPVIRDGLNLSLD
ncbi:hypothetical protein C8R42DRAFT_697635 [Lentinula raphanica]|nr:hypothetical protein C8R42DRAFT_697635 [Lentinula raphanica]